MIMVPAIVVLAGIAVGYYFKSKLDAKNKRFSIKLIPPKKTTPKKEIKLEAVQGKKKPKSTKSKNKN